MDSSNRKALNEGFGLIALVGNLRHKEAMGSSHYSSVIA
jgi:hypothetical protein